MYNIIYIQPKLAVNPDPYTKELQDKFESNYDKTSEIIKNSLPFSKEAIQLHEELKQHKELSPVKFNPIKHHDSKPIELITHFEEQKEISSPLSKSSQKLLKRLNNQ